MTGFGVRPEVDYELADQDGLPKWNMHDWYAEMLLGLGQSAHCAYLKLNGIRGIVKAVEMEDRILAIPWETLLARKRGVGLKGWRNSELVRNARRSWRREL